MSTQIYLVLVLTFIIYLIGGLAYAPRVVGVKTGRIAVAFAIFNVFALIQRTANTFQAPFLAGFIERNIQAGTSQNLLYLFRWILGLSTLAAIAGAALMPTFIRLFTKAVESFSEHRSIPKLLIHGFSKAGVEQFRKSLVMPKKGNIKELKNFMKIPKKIVLLNTLAFSLSTVGGLAVMYASCLDPSSRMVCTTLSSVINGMSTILMFIFIDPFISMMTDDVIRGESSIESFNRCIIFILGGQIIGTVFAQFLLVPAANLIVVIASLF